MRTKLIFLLSFPFIKPILSLVEYIFKKQIRILLVPQERIGHQVMNNELYLRKKHVSSSWPYFDILVIRNIPVANEYMLELFERKVCLINGRKSILNNILARVLESHYPTYGYQFPMESNEYEETTHSPQAMHFNEKEKIIGQKLLKEMQITENDWYICIHARDPAYLNETYPDRDFSYHDHRDCSIQNFMKAAEFICEKGGFVVRMGTSASPKLPENRNKNIIDYAHDFRTEFGDIFIPSRCKFFLGCTAGPFNIASIFGKPVVMTNVSPISYPPQRAGDLFIPKKYYDRNKESYMTYREVLRQNLDNYIFDWKNSSYEAVENTEEEIYAVCKEMNERLDGEYHEPSNAQELQRLWWRIFPKNYRTEGANIAPIILSHCFIEENRALIEPCRL